MTPEESDAAFDHWFSESPVMAILRGYPAAEAVSLTQRAWATGFALVEVPLSHSGNDEALSAVTNLARREGRVAGAGTVVTLEDVNAAVTCGARFTVAPGWDPEVAQASLAAGLPHLPGVMTPTDVQHAWTSGFRWLKVFPASVIGPEMFKALHGPFRDLRMVATGGIDDANAASYIAAGAFGVSLSDATAWIGPDTVRALAYQRRQMEVQQ